MNPYEKLTKANDDYHEAFDEILMDEVLPSEVKAKFGSFHNNIFKLMNEARNLIGPYYGIEPPEENIEGL